MPKTMKENTPLMYKGKPLMRKGKHIYYGDPKDKYRVFLEIDEDTDILGLSIATHVYVQLQTNAVPGREKVIKKAERDGLYAALDLGEFWLTDILSEEA